LSDASEWRGRGEEEGRGRERKGEEGKGRRGEERPLTLFAARTRAVAIVRVNR
jgi:hypothetical protein